MIKKLPYFLALLMLLGIPSLNFGQVPNMGTTVNFVLFSSNGAVSNTGITHLTGNVGTNSGSSTGFGNVDGGMHDNDLVSGQCAADLLIAYNDLNSAIPSFFIGPLLGNGDILVPGVYSVSPASTLNLELILDGQGDPDALFIFKINGAFSTNANAKVKLINGTQACNVFWKVEGLVDMASGTTMRGTVIANNAAILMGVGDTLEGRALSIAGAVTVSDVFAYTPIGCGSPVLTGPTAPSLGSTACYGIFSADGPVTNSGITFVTGDVGTNVGLTTGFDPLNVAGIIHPIPDASTLMAASDLSTAYTYLNTLSADIELLYPAQFGNDLVLTPHTYIINGATTFTDSLYLNGLNNPDAVFVIQINGALSTGSFSNVILTNGTQSKNVFWKVDGAVQINDYSTFRGTLIANNGAVDLTTGVALDGRAMTTTGALNTAAINSVMPAGCATIYNPVIVSSPSNDTVCVGQPAVFSVIATGTGLMYQWRKGTTDLVNGGAISGATSATLTVDPVGISDYVSDYNVVVSGTGGPDQTSSDAALVSCLVGLESYVLDSAYPVVTIYPNPFTESLCILFQNDEKINQSKLGIYNLLGEEVSGCVINSKMTILDVSTLAPGVYVYKLIDSGDIIQTGRLVSANHSY